MPWKVKVEVRGLQEILDTLKGIRKAIRRRILKKALRGAGKVLLKAARSNVNTTVRYGDLKKSLGVRVKAVKGKPDVVAAIVGPRTGRRRVITTASGRALPINPTKYAHLVELGAQPHQITITTGPYAGMTIDHPGARPQPFLRPAIDQNRDAVREVLAEEIAKGILEQTAKEGAKGKSIRGK